MNNVNLILTVFGLYWKIKMAIVDLEEKYLAIAIIQKFLITSTRITGR